MGQYDYKLSFLLRENVRSALAEDIVQPPKKTERVLLHFGPTKKEREQSENANAMLDDEKAKKEKEKNLKKILKRLEKQGFETTSRLGDIAAGNIALTDIERMTLHPNVISIESTQVLNTELDESAKDIGLEDVRTEFGNRMHKGNGVIVAVIDSGFDIMHPCFRDAKGKTRIIAFWNQNQKIEDIEIDPASKLSYKPPKPFNYGVNYTYRHINKAIEIENKFVSAHLGEINEAVQQAKDASGNIDAEKEKEIRTQIEKELRAKALKDAMKIVPRERDSKDCSHGTHVAAIAAGSGVSTKIAAEDGTSLGDRNTPFLGMAPEADLILVSYRNKQNGRLGGSAFVVDAIKYILDVAESKDKAVVINFSQGTNIGSHDGKSLLEQAIDNILDRKGVAFVNSAGNARGDATHFRDKMVHKGKCVIKLKVDGKKEDIGDDTIDIWYGPQDRFDVAVASPTPGGAQPDNLLQTPKVMPASTVTFRLGNGNDVHVRSRLDDAENHANRIIVILKRGEKPVIEPGEWSIILSGREVKDGVFHAWIDNTKDEPFPTFVTPKDDFTITIPGTSKKVITVGAHYSRSPTKEQWGEKNPKPLPEVGDVVEFSSLGPIVEIKKINDKLFMSLSEATKPELMAPGAMVISAFDTTKGRDKDGYGLLAGTSMSAPHVAGIIALLFERDKNMTQDDIRKILVLEEKSKVLKDELDKEPPAPPAQRKPIVKLAVKKFFGEELEEGFKN